MNDRTRRIVRVAAPYALASLAIMASEGWLATRSDAAPAWAPPRVLGLIPMPTAVEEASEPEATVAATELEAATAESTAVTDSAAVVSAVSVDSGSQLAGSIPSADTGRTEGAPVVPDTKAVVHGFLSVPGPALAAFLSSLDSLQRNDLSVVRVAHYGDSQIEGDRFTMHLRRALQEPLGNVGVGYVPIISEVANFRVTVRHRFSPNWTQRDRRGTGPFQYGTGPGGLAFAPAATGVSTANYQTQGNLSSVALGLAPAATPLTLRFTFGSADTTPTMIIPPHARDTVVTVRPAGRSREVQLTASGDAALFGVWLQEESRGIAVDNYSRRGSAGDHLVHVTGCAIEREAAVGPTRLVMLMFGINVLLDSPSGYGWYGTRLRGVIANLRRCFPSASILVIGPALRGVRDPLGVRESRGVPLMALALRRTAVAEGAAYWDQTAAMRQIAPFETWATSGMLSADLAHYSDAASRRLGRRLAADLLAARQPPRGTTPTPTPGF